MTQPGSARSDEPWRRGDRLILDETRDEHLIAGTLGTVRFVDSLGTIHVQWDTFTRPPTSDEKARGVHRPVLKQGLRRGVDPTSGDFIRRPTPQEDPPQADQ